MQVTASSNLQGRFTMAFSHGRGDALSRASQAAHQVKNRSTYGQPPRLPRTAGTTPSPMPSVSTKMASQHKARATPVFASASSCDDFSVQAKKLAGQGLFDGILGADESRRTPASPFQRSAGFASSQMAGSGAAYRVNPNGTISIH